MKFSKRVERMQESKTIEMARLARQLRKEGRDVISLSLGDIDFETPCYVKEAAHKAIVENFSHYPPVEGYPDLLQAIIDKIYEQSGYTYKHENILVSNGAKHTLANIILSLIDNGDEVILPVPYWVTYDELVNLAGGKQVYIQTSFKNGFKLTADELESHISEKTKLLILNNPNNPTGAVYTKDELLDLANVITKYPNLWVISDEVYDHLVYDADFYSMAAIDKIRSQLILVNSVSKTYAMTGWRIGYMAAPEPLVKVCKKLQGQMTSGANAIAQKAAAAALKEGKEVLAKRLKIMNQRRVLMIRKLSELDRVKFVEPKGSFYIFPLFDEYFGKNAPNGQSINNSRDLSLYLLQQANVAVVSGDAFGFEGALRLSFSVESDKISAAMERIKDALKKIK